MLSSRTYNSFRAWIGPIKRLLRRTLGRQTFSSVQPGVVGPPCIVPERIVRPGYALDSNYNYNASAPQHVDVKNAAQIDRLRLACKLAKRVLHLAGKKLRVGMTTEEVDKIVHDECITCNSYPSPLLYKKFPKSVCTSVNNVACHGIPDNRPLEDGDIINVDISVYYRGFHGDCSETFLVGEVDEAGRRLVNVARQCRDAGIAVCRPGSRICDVGYAISDLAESLGYKVVPYFCGHGIGEYFHGPPEVVHFRDETGDYGQLMEPGMTFTIEPVISEGSDEIEILDDGWTAVSIDGSRSAQFEHTVLITKTGVEVLTRFYQDEYEEI